MKLRRDKEAASLATVSLCVKERKKKVWGGKKWGCYPKRFGGKERNERSRQNEKTLVKVREKWKHHQGARRA